MCGFLRKALVMSFTTLCTSTATSSFVSAMLAAAAIRRASGRTQPPAGVSRGRARARWLRRALAEAAEHFRVREGLIAAGLDRLFTL